MRFDVLTLFPRMFDGYLGQSILRKAIDRGLIDVQLHDFREFTRDRHRSVDDRPYGGGPGMVICVEPVVECVEAVQAAGPAAGRLIMLSPQGRRLDQTLVEDLAGSPRLVLMCGRYEGFDQRVVDLLRPEEVSIGDYIVNGGEVAAMVVIDAVLRLVPGVLGDERSARDDSFSGAGRLLEGPQYTRPPEFRGLAVPDILLSGDHRAIARWRQEQAFHQTRRRRADLLPSPADRRTSDPSGDRFQP